jgi:hypothetical protein
MYGLEKNIDLSFLTNKDLLQIAVSQFQITLYFSDEVTVSIEGNFQHNNQINTNKSPNNASSLLDLLGSKTIEVENSGDGSIKISFSNGDVLNIFDSNKEYESYQLVNRKVVIVV